MQLSQVIASFTPTKSKTPSTNESLTAPARRPRRRRFGRIALEITAAASITLIALWIAIHRVSWLGPALANSLRSVIGTEAVTRLEEWAYGAQDRWNRLSRRREPPKAYWSVPSAEQPSRPVPEATASAEPRTPVMFAPRNVGPFDAKVAAAGDGIWVPVLDGEHPEETPLLYKTLLHPDRKRPWAELFLVALDLRRIDVYAVAGTVDPESTTAEGRAYTRLGLIPVEHQHELVIVFNGGFKTEHGHYGMNVGGVTLVPPRPRMCTFAAYRDGSLRIAAWEADLAQAENEMRWWRQTPPCMVTAGGLHPGLTDKVTSWGAALGGETVIRRSAVGLDSDASVLYVGVSNSTTARAIADGMSHGGGHHVAQLDVNWSFPKIVVFRRNSSGEREAAGLFSGFVFDRDEGLRKRSPRDFFYVVRRGASRNGR